MNTKKRTLTTLLACVMVVCTLLASALPASAATCSNGTSTQTIKVETKADWWKWGSESITLTQTKGECRMTAYKYWPLFEPYTKKTETYGRWDISVQSDDGSHSYETKLTGATKKVDLEPDKTYTITVKWNETDELSTMYRYGQYTTYPAWYVSDVHKVIRYE